MDRISVIIPCYNEQEVLPETARRLRGLSPVDFPPGDGCRSPGAVHLQPVL